MDNSILPSFSLPLSAILYSKPDEEITEAQKFADGGIFFQNMSRWITINFFNRNMPSFYNGVQDATIRGSEDIIENFAYYYGRQQNKTFAYTETINEQDTIQAVYVPDQKIRQIIDHAVGNAVKMIQPIKDSISAKKLSEDAVKGRELLRRKLQAKKDLNKMLSQIPGITYAPAGVEDIGEDDDIDDIIDRFKKQEELKFIKLGQSVYFNNQLEKKLEQSALHELVGNISHFLVDVVGGETDITFCRSYNSIIDYRATDDFLSDALVGGAVQFLSPAEIFAKWGNELTEDERNHINRMSQKQYSNWQECYNFYNSGTSNLTWWCQDTGKVSCATTYWIGKKNLPYRKKKTSYGTTKLQFLDPNKEYHVFDSKGQPILDNGKPVMKKGNDIQTEGIWAVHKCTIIGNYCSVNKGYHPLQIRPRGLKGKPLLPTVTFINRLEMGYFRSMVSRLKHYSEERGRLKLKIQELTGRDMGKVYALFADKMGLAENEAQEVMKDFKSMGFSLFNRTGEAGDENGTLRADMLDFSLQPSITAYIQLWKEEAAEMESIVNMNNVAMGLQTNTLGKGVQDRSIAQSTLGQLSLYDGLMEHWRRLLQYALNCEKINKAGKETVIQTDTNEAYLLNINKSETWEELGLWIEPSDALEGQQQQVLHDSLFALSQNGGSVEATEALLNTMQLLQFNSAAEGIQHLQEFVDKKKKEQMEQQQMAQQQQMQQSQMEISLSKMFDEKMQASKDENANYRAEITATLSALAKMHGDVEKSTAQMLQMLGQMQPQTPINQDLAQQQQAMQQQAPQEQS